MNADSHADIDRRASKAVNRLGERLIVGAVLALAALGAVAVLAMWSTIASVCSTGFCGLGPAIPATLTVVGLVVGVGLTARRARQGSWPARQLLLLLGLGGIAVAFVSLLRTVPNDSAAEVWPAIGAAFVASTLLAIGSALTLGRPLVAIGVALTSPALGILAFVALTTLPSTITSNSIGYRLGGLAPGTRVEQHEGRDFLVHPAPTWMATHISGRRVPESLSLDDYAADDLSRRAPGELALEEITFHGEQAQLRTYHDASDGYFIIILFVLHEGRGYTIDHTGYTEDYAAERHRLDQLLASFEFQP